jgi:hypothetical protein
MIARQYTFNSSLTVVSESGKNNVYFTVTYETEFSENADYVVPTN